MAIFNPFRRNKVEEKQEQDDRSTNSKSLTKELGVYGDMIFNGFDREEERLDKIKIADYRKMRDTDATIDGLIKIIIYPILAATYGVKADVDDVDNEQMNFIRESLFEPAHKGGMETPFSLVLDQMLHAVYEGFSLFERVYKLDSEGRLVINKMAYRDSTTISLTRDKTGGYDGARQKAQFGDKTVDVKLPSYKTFLFTYDKASDYLYGRSVLKPTFRNWDKKRKMEYFDSVAIQSKAITPKLLKRISDAIVKGGGGNNKTALRMAAKLGEFASAMSLPNGYDITELKGGNNDNVHESIERQNSEMARAFLANFMLSGSQGSQNVGSYNLSTNQSNIFMLSLRGLMNLIVEHINDYWIADLIDINYPVGKRYYPTFYLDDLTSDVAEFMQQVFTTLVQKDKISNDLVIEVEKQVASRLGIDSENLDLNANASNTATTGSEEDNGRTAEKFHSKQTKIKDAGESDIDILDEAEGNVNFASIEKFLDKTEARFEPKATDLLTKYLDEVANNPEKPVELSNEYVKLLETTYQSAYNYGKLSASNELGEKAPKTTEAQAEHTQRYVDFVIEKQTSDIDSMIAEAKIQLPVEVGEGEAENSNLMRDLILTAAAVWVLRAVQGTKSTIANSGLGAGRSDAITVLADDGDLRMWSSRMEANTCATCSALHGTTYNLQQWLELKYKPGDVHFNCRCIEILLRKNDNYDLPEPTGPPSDIDEIDHMRITAKSELQKQGLVGSSQTKKAAIEKKLHNPIDDGDNLVTVEKNIRDLDIEHFAAFDKSGTKLVNLIGTENQVPIGNSWDYMIENRVTLATHNHPRSLSFSDDDISVAAGLNLDEIRAVSSKYTYTLRPGSNGWPTDDEIRADYDRYYDQEYTKMAIYLDSKGLEWTDANRSIVIHETVTRLSSQYLLKYSRSKYE